MGNIFSQPDPRIIQTPRESTTVGSTSVRPYAPVEPFIKNILNPLARTFTAAPKLYEGGLTPADSPQTLAARDIYGQVGETAAGLAPTYGDLFSRDLALARGDITEGFLEGAFIDISGSYGRNKSTYTLVNTVNPSMGSLNADQPNNAFEAASPSIVSPAFFPNNVFLEPSPVD